MKILIVEDEIRIREGIKKLLKKLNQDNVVAGEAGNGAEGISMARELQPDVIITDIRMPGMDGLEMLKQLFAEGCRAKAIVLSAYSEFEYARQAIKLGVSEYLLKPVALGEFTQAIENISGQLEKDKVKEPKQMGSLEQILKGIINGGLVIDKELAGYARQRYGVKENTRIVVMTGYFEDWEEKKIRAAERTLRQLLEQKEGLSFCILKDENRKMLQAFLYGYGDAQEVKRYIQISCLRMRSEINGVAMAWTEAENIYSLESHYREVCKILEWSISLGDDVIISYPEVLNVQTSVCVYPIEIENRMKQAMCANQTAALKKIAEQFHSYFQDSKIYEPGKIKECYVRFFWSVINFGKETGNLKAENLEQQTLLERILQARTRQELKKVTDSILEAVTRKEREEIENLVVKRAVSMIKEYYRTGITLEELASGLNITPEYLGTQFHKAMGLTFSIYIRDYRIAKAKELLLGTSLKLYEIAERVGYSDSKYFSKVFKEVTGQLPGDYRRTYR